MPGMRLRPSNLTLPFSWTTINRRAGFSTHSALYNNNNNSSSSSSDTPPPPPGPNETPLDSPASFPHTTRRIGKVPRPARPGPPPQGPPQRKYPKPLPAQLPRTEWLDQLATTPAIRARPTLINEQAARDLVRAWGVDRMEDVTVVDVYAGAGGLTKAFLELDNVKRVICIEDAFRYQPQLHAMRTEEEAKNPGRLILTEMDSFTWEAYTEAGKHLDHVPKIPWDQPNDKLFLSGQLPNNRHGDQLFVQLVTAAANRMWYFQKGRFSMGFLGSENYWKKIFAQPGEAAHHKLSVLLPALASLSYVSILSDFRPVETHFHRPRGDPAHIKAIKVTPRRDALVRNYEALEYCAKHMFVGKAMPWPKAVAAIVPGSANLVPKLVDQGMTDMKKTVTQLTLEEWIKIADTFDDWPFRPTTLMDAWGEGEDQ